MSTFLWANYLVDGIVTSDEADKYTLYKFASKPDAICTKQGESKFSALFDSTDVRFNLDQVELAPGMESINELMSRDGIWLESRGAIEIFERLLETIRSDNIKFGFIGNAQGEIVSELNESIQLGKEALRKSAKFSFAVVT